MNKTLVLNCVTIGVGLWMSASASAQDPDSLNFSRESQKQRDLIYGNAPALSREARPISKTAEQEGHYVAGVSERSPRFPEVAPEPSEPTQVASNPSAGVLIAVPRTQRVLEEEPRPTTRANQRSAQVNDSQSLEQTVEEHKWTLPF